VSLRITSESTWMGLHKCELFSFVAFVSRNFTLVPYVGIYWYVLAERVTEQQQTFVSWTEIRRIRNLSGPPERRAQIRIFIDPTARSSCGVEVEYMKLTVRN
jgi:hypothetical protein